MSARFRGPIVACAAFLSLLGAMLLLSARTALAQGSTDPKVAAKEHYTRGTSFYDLGRYDDAIKEFEAAYQLKNDPAFLYNLAQSYRQAGNHEQAVHFYKTYLRYVPKAPNRADIEEKIKTEEQLVAKGTTGGGTTPPPANTTTTPPPANTTTTPPPANTTTTPPPGADTVTTPPAPPPGYAPPPAYGPPPGSPMQPPMPSPSDPGRKFRVAGLATAGGGGLLMLIGVLEYTVAKKASNDVENAAKNNDSFDPAVEDRGKSAEKMQWVFYGLGTLAVAAGVGLWFYGQHVTAAETTTWRVSLAPTLGPSQGGATLRVNF